MSFFGFEKNDLETDKQRFLDSGSYESEDVAVYTWGEESYDGLGDALQEGGDELNDETFGGNGNVGKDFDFTVNALPPAGYSKRKIYQYSDITKEQAPHSEVQSVLPRSTQSPRSTTHSLEAIWDDRSPLSVLPRINGAGRSAEHPHVPSATKLSHFPSGELLTTRHQPSPVGVTQTGVRTLQEIEAEMRAAAQQSRGASAQRQHAILLQQQQQQQQQELQAQQHIQLQRLQQQQQQQQQQQRTPPPRMLPVSQSPRFHEHQRQILLLQQQQEQQEQQRLQELQEQLRLEEIERLMRAQQISQINQGPNHLSHQRQSGPSLIDLQATQMIKQRRQSPAYQDQVPMQQSMPYLPQSIQLQQRLLSEMAQAEFIRDMQGASPVEQEALRMEAMRKIMEAERMEEKRRRKAAKIAHMARYNDLMTQSDKDFITRIQVSQLVTQDPYAEDFYAQVYGAILRSRLGLQSQDERVLKFGSGGGVGLGLAQKANSRRPSAMQRMEAQVERIVSNARLREKEKGLHSLHSLQGALGKTSGRSYKAAPRQLLQVDAGNPSTSPVLSPTHAHISKEDAVRRDGEGAAREAAKLGREALGNAADTDGLVRKDPLSQREILVILENLYDLVLRVEQLRREQPPQEDEEGCIAWDAEYTELAGELWDGLKVMVPLETSDPHPFISLLMPTKGKKLLPRLTRHLTHQQMLTLLTLLVACFSQLDVVVKAPLLDSLDDTKERQEVDHQTQTFLGSVLQSILPIVAKASLRLISGLLGLLLDRSNIVVVMQTRPGLALLTLFLSRVEVIKQTIASATEVSNLPSPEEAQQWQLMLDHLFQLITPYLRQLFPSTRIALVLSSLPSHLTPPADIVDQPVWQFLAALALHASTEQQQTLVATLREKVLENVLNRNKGYAEDDEEREARLANVNLFLHALGLFWDGTQFIYKSCQWSFFLSRVHELIGLVRMHCP